MVPAIVLTEVRKIVLRKRGLARADKVTLAMRSGIVAPIGDEIAVSAADIAIKRQLPLAASLIYESPSPAAPPSGPKTTTSKTSPTSATSRKPKPNTPTPFGIKLHLSGEFVCYTRPEMKLERVPRPANSM